MVRHKIYTIIQILTVLIANILLTPVRPLASDKSNLKFAIIRD